MGCSAESPLALGSEGHHEASRGEVPCSCGEVCPSLNVEVSFDESLGWVNIAAFVDVGNWHCSHGHVDHPYSRRHGSDQRSSACHQHRLGMNARMCAESAYWDLPPLEMVLACVAKRVLAWSVEK